MSGNLPYIVLGGIVLGVLFLKGYLKLPESLIPKPASQSFAPPSAVQGPTAARPLDVDELSNLGSFVLGAAFAKAVKREAESSLATQFAKDAGDALHAKYTAPFSPSPAPPAGPSDPNPAGLPS